MNEDIKVTFDSPEDLGVELDAGVIQYGKLQIGTTTTGAAGTKAKVENVGSSGNAILNFTIPKGDKGEKGDKGNKGDAGTIKFIVVAELPIENIDESAIYMKPSSNQDENNTYEEFIYADGKWESLGAAQVKIDLEPYATKEELNQLQDNVEEVFNGKEPMGSIVVDDISCKNLFAYGVTAFDKTSTYRTQPTQQLILSSISMNEIKFSYNNGNYSMGYIEISGVDGTKDYSISYKISENTTSYAPYMSIDKTNSTSDKLVIMINGGNGSTSVSSSNYFVLTEIQLEKGKIITNYVPYKEYDNNKINVTEYVTLATGYTYRKVGSDVELNVKLGTATTFNQASLTKIGTLSEGHRPKENIFVPVFAINSSNAGVTTLRLLVQTNGEVTMQNLGGSSVTISYLSTFVRYSTL